MVVKDYALKQSQIRMSLQVVLSNFHGTVDSLLYKLFKKIFFKKKKKKKLPSLHS